MTSTETLSVAYDDVSRPFHYNAHPSGVEIKDITGAMSCPHLSNATKYMCRFEHKGNPVQDLDKAKTYIRFELHRRWDAGTYTSPLPKEHPVYRPEYAPFYLYLASEPNPAMRNILILIWNADKTDGTRAESMLKHAIDLIDEEMVWRKRQLEDAAARQVAESIERERAEAAERGTAAMAELRAAAARQRLTEIQQPEPKVERVEVTDRAAKLLHYISEGDQILLPNDSGESDDDWWEVTGVMRRGSKWVVQCGVIELEMHGNKKITVSMDKERIS